MIQWLSTPTPTSPPSHSRAPLLHAATLAPSKGRVVLIFCTVDGRFCVYIPGLIELPMLAPRRFLRCSRLSGFGALPGCCSARAGMALPGHASSACVAHRLHPPCLPTAAPQPPSGTAWMHEIKHDGHRPQNRRACGQRFDRPLSPDWPPRRIPGPFFLGAVVGLCKRMGAPGGNRSARLRRVCRSGLCGPER
jgi:hypothetical protein